MRLTTIKYKKSNVKILFGAVEDRACFYSNGVLYMKILSQDLKAFNITNVNAISIINAGLTFFDADEVVDEATKEVD